MSYKISIIHPSRSRPDQANKTIKNWLDKAHYPSQIQYILSLDNNDYTRIRYDRSLPIKIISNNNRSAIQAINNGAKLAEANIIVVVSDDFCCPQHWDKTLLELLNGKEDFCIKTKDGLQDFIITLPIMDRKYYERFGYIYPPGYQHLWSDSELSCVAWMLGKYAEIDMSFPHNHYSTGKCKKDVVSIKNDRSWKQGKRLFYERKKKKFNLNEVQIEKDFPYFAGYERDL